MVASATGEYLTSVFSLHRISFLIVCSLTGITKLSDANHAGTRNASQCTLILTEGDSAKALAVAGLGVVGRDFFGVFPLRGKLLNVREAKHDQNDLSVATGFKGMIVAGGGFSSGRIAITRDGERWSDGVLPDSSPLFGADVIGDTLYTMAWLDVGPEPWVLSVPDMQGRYYLLPFLSGWTDVFEVPGKRTTGTKAQRYVITGPGWSGDLPKGVTELKSPTSLVWMLGRIYSSGTPADYAAVHRLQDRFRLVPLSAYGKTYTPTPGEVDPSLDEKTPVREQVNRLDAATYFKLLADLMKANPPAPEDAPMVERMAKIGLVPGQAHRRAGCPMHAASPCCWWWRWPRSPAA